MAYTPADAFTGGVNGFWLDAVPITNFQDAASGGVDLGSYSTRAIYTALYGKWKDLSGNNNHALEADAFSRGSAISESAWQFAGNVYEDLTISNVGGSSTGFYFAAAMALGSYYGTIFSDQSSSTSSNGFRIWHNADGDGANPLIVFSANGHGGTGGAQGSPNINANTQVRIASGGTVYQNGSFSNLFVLECWYDGTYLYARRNGGTITRSTNAVTVSAGGSTAYLNSNLGTDFGGSGVDLYAVVMTKNSVPSQAIRDDVRGYLTNRISSGGARSLTGQSLTVSRGTVTASNNNAVTVALSGKSLSVSRGTVSPAASTQLSGLGLTVSRGSIGADAGATANVTGHGMTVSTGTMVVESSGATLALTGQSMTVSRGAVGVSGALDRTLTGHEMTVSIGNVLVSSLQWARIDTRQTPGWTKVDTT